MVPTTGRRNGKTSGAKIWITRYGGKQIGRIQILSITREPIVKMPESDYDAEGFKYMEEQGLTIWKKPPRQAFERWKLNGGSYWVVRFKVLED